MVELVDYSISYGECVGYCTSALTIDGLSIELIQTSNGPDVEKRRFTGEIEPGLSQRIIHAAAYLAQENLAETYGTPDARDEGAVMVRIRGREGASEHRYSRGGPPTEFVALDDLVSPILIGWIDGDSVDSVRFDDSP